MALNIEAPALPKGSLVFVTGVNGFNGSHIVDEVLKAGYRVRGTVRDAKKGAWLTDFFTQRYGKDVFELIGLSDLKDPGAYKGKLEGVAGVIHSASDLSFNPDPNVVVKNTMDFLTSILEEIEKVPSVKRFVYTSSSTALTLPNPGVKCSISTDSWNEDAVKTAWAPPPYTQERSYAVYGASKTQAEQALFKYVKERKPTFVVNTVIPGTVFGEVLSRENQGEPSTAAMAPLIYTNGKNNLQAISSFLPSQWGVNVRDIARLHVLGLLHPAIKEERLLGLGWRYDLNQILAVMRKHWPSRSFADDLPDLKKDLSDVKDWERFDGYLRDSYDGLDGFTPLEPSIMNNLEVYVKNPDEPCEASGFAAAFK